MSPQCAPLCHSPSTLIGASLCGRRPSDAFTWSIYNWSTASYETLGNQNNCGGVTGLHTCNADGQSFGNWKWLQYNALRATITNYVNSTTREIRLQLASSNASSYINVDWESV